MTRPRLVLITRRFWPLVGGAEIVMSNLASEFRNLGATARIVTAQWEPDWPAEVVYRETPVTRLPNPPLRGWGTFRYMTSLSRWLRRNRPHYDGVLVSMLKHDAYAALRTLQQDEIPVVLRAEGGGTSGDCHWQATARFGRRIRRRCRTADALVAPSDAIRDEILAAGYPEDRTHTIANGVRVEPPPDEARREEARAALAEANYDLATCYGGQIVVFTGRLHRAKGLFELVNAWRSVSEAKPNARLWLIGEGPDREALYERIVDYGLHHQICLPGAFDQIDDVLAAADLFVLPSYEEGMSLSLLEAMAAHVPAVATDIPGNRKLITHDEQGLLVPPKNVGALAEAIRLLLNHPARAQELAAAAFERVRAGYSLTKMARTHLELFERLQREKRTR